MYESLFLFLFQECLARAKSETSCCRTQIQRFLFDRRQYAHTYAASASLFSSVLEGRWRKYAGCLHGDPEIPCDGVVFICEIRWV